jgi:chemosensory pili system protein ChpA (sensor histidine kinase/response regulator)
MQPDQQQRIMGYFIEEAKDHLNTIEQGLLNLQATIEDAEMVNEVFRAAHSIKGGAAMLGLGSIQQVAHRLEDYFKVLKETSIRVDQKLESLFLKVFDALQELVGQLQGSFGLTEENAGVVISGVEPTFTALEQHLSQLAIDTPSISREPVAEPAFVFSHHSENAVEELFKGEVAARLREMLQLFKQSEAEAGTRQRLQEICRSLGSMGEQYDLSAWCHLLETARQAIAHSENSYRILAPIVIKDIKQAQEMVIAGRAGDIEPCDQLQALLPAESLTDTVLQNDLADLLAEADDMALLDNASDLYVTDFNLTELGFDQGLSSATDFSLSGLAPIESGLNLEADLNAPLGDEDFEAHQGPEVGMAELNTLADLFEGDMPDLGLTWQEEEIISNDDSEMLAITNATQAFDASSDFSDLLFDEEPSEANSFGTSDDELNDLFGDDLDSSSSDAAIAQAPLSSAPVESSSDNLDQAGILDTSDDFDDLLTITSSSSPDMPSINLDDVLGELSLEEDLIDGNSEDSPDDIFAGLGLEENLMDTGDSEDNLDDIFGLGLGEDLTDTTATSNPLEDFGLDLEASSEPAIDFDSILNEDTGDLTNDLVLAESAPVDVAAPETIPDPWGDVEVPEVTGIALGDMILEDMVLEESNLDNFLDSLPEEPLLDSETSIEINEAPAGLQLESLESVASSDVIPDPWGDLEETPAPAIASDSGTFPAPSLDDFDLNLEDFNFDESEATELGLSASSPQIAEDHGTDSDALSDIADDALLPQELLPDLSLGFDDSLNSDLLDDSLFENLENSDQIREDLPDISVASALPMNEDLLDFELEPTSTKNTEGSLDLMLQAEQISAEKSNDLDDLFGEADLFETDSADSLDLPSNSSLEPAIASSVKESDDLDDLFGEADLFETDSSDSLDLPSDSSLEPAIASSVEESDDLDDLFGEADLFETDSSDLDLFAVSDDISVEPAIASSAEESNDLDDLFGESSLLEGDSTDALNLIDEDLQPDPSLDMANDDLFNLEIEPERLLTFENEASPEEGLIFKNELPENELPENELFENELFDSESPGLDFAVVEDSPAAETFLNFEEATFTNDVALDGEDDLGLDSLDSNTDLSSELVGLNYLLSENVFSTQDPADDLLSENSFSIQDPADELNDLLGSDEQLLLENSQNENSSVNFLDNAPGLAGLDELNFAESEDLVEVDSLSASELFPENSTFATDDFSDLGTLLGKADSLGVDRSSEISVDDEISLSPSNDLADNDFTDLDTLLEEDTSISDNGEFDELEALLDVNSAFEPGVMAFGHEDPSNSQSLAAELDDFADLESLLGNEGELTVNAESAITAAENSSEFDDLDDLLKDAEEKMGGVPSVKVARSSVPQIRRTNRPTRGFSEQTMRVPVKHLDNLSNLVGELVVNRNSLEQDQERLRQSLDNLLYQVQQLSDVGQRMQDLYERSLLESSLLAGRQGYRSNPFQANFRAVEVVENDSTPSNNVEYDPLEMDRFTSFHSLSQEMIELIVRVRESSSDIEFIVDETEQVTRMFRQVTTQLQEGLTRSRMVPFAQTADRLPRAVRDISMKVGKQAELIIEGRETLIDKMILEQLYDPMTHLVNNAITHGIESPEVRRTAGKPSSGRIVIRAFHQGNQTILSVSDDGAGIDVERVKAKAVEKRLISQTEARSLSRLDVYDILFHPGFSTKDQADDYSGRGVGMDVVRTSLSEIRGVINIDSTPGKGTIFTIRLPLTLSISKALCCISDRARIAFPMDGVEDMLDLPKERLQLNAEGYPSIAWRDTILPVRPLADLLGYNRHLGRGNVYGGNQEDDIVSVVVLRSAGNFLALQVDQVLGEQEIVIKQLEGPVPKPIGVAGATVLGDGRIMPIADVLELIDVSTGRIRRDSGGSLWEQSDDGILTEPPVTKTEPMVLIVDDSITVRELLSMTFNKVGYRVEQARDGQEAWEKLRSGLPCDIVFCDIEMPRMDGLELLSRIQKDPNLKLLPIAMLTSRGADRHRQMAATLGASGYFTKPYLEEALLDAAQRMLKGERLLNNP